MLFRSGFLVGQHEVGDDFDVDPLRGVREEADEDRLVFMVYEDVSRVVQDRARGADDRPLVVHVDDVDPEVFRVFVDDHLGDQLLCQLLLPRSSRSTV